MKVIYNPASPRGANVKDIFQQSVYEQQANTVQVYENDNLAKYLLGKFGFLREIPLSQVKEIKKEIIKNANGFVEEPEKELSDDEKKMLEGIEVAAPTATVAVKQKSAESVAFDIPQQGSDRDGIEWYGPGEENDSNDMIVGRVPGVTKGVFGAA